MRCFILGVLLSFPQTPSAVLPKASDRPAGATHNTQNKAAAEENPPAPQSPPAETTAPAKNKDSHNAVRPEDAQQPVRVRELPPVSVSRDWADWALWVFNGLLVVAGFLGIRLAYKTLQTIQEQTEATRKAAEATEKSVELQKVAMDQWIDVDELEAQKHILPTAAESEFPVGFRLGNPTKFPLTLRSVTVWIDRKHVQTVGFRNLLLSPDEGIPVLVKWQIEGVKLAKYRANCLMFELGGVISFIDAFK